MSANQPTNRRIVIVEDKKQEAFKLRQIVEGAGHHTIGVCENGRELIELLEQKRPGEVDLVLCDLIMPVLDGYAAFFEAREKKLSTRFVFVSVENSKAVIDSLMQAGAAGYIVKPIDREAVLGQLKEALLKPAPRW